MLPLLRLRLWALRSAETRGVGTGHRQRQHSGSSGGGTSGAMFGGTAGIASRAQKTWTCLRIGHGRMLVPELPGAGERRCPPAHAPGGLCSGTH